MRYHDFQLAGYRVSDFGGTISLDLVYDYPGQPRVHSAIEFSGVIAYHFVHTGGAILNHIGEETIENLLRRFGGSMAEWWRLYGGYPFWDDDPRIYRANLETQGYRAWIIDSAVGFEGFVVAKALKQAGSNQNVQAAEAAPRVMCLTSSYEELTVKALQELGIPISFVTQRRRPLREECDDLVSIGLDMFGREQWLERRAASKWQTMVANAKHEGVLLMAVSGFRSFDYQRKLVERKLAAGLTFEQIICVSALPGFSEHHTGRAMDIGTPGCPPVTEEFERTPAFDWLTRRGREFGFRMTYPRDNPFGAVYEPWHWNYDEKAT